MNLFRDAVTAADTASSLSGAEAAEQSLRLQDVHCSLGSRQVLRGLSTQPLPCGELVAVVGPNGAGKSTLLRCIGGFLPCEARRMALCGQDLRPLKPSQRASIVRYLPQSAPGMLHLSVHDCLKVALHTLGGSASAHASQSDISRVVNQLGLGDLLLRYLDELSGGQKQRVWLAQALLHQPKALLLDEPLAALDPSHQHHVMRLLRQLAIEQQLVVVVVVHDLNMAVRYADQVIVLQQGEVVAQGPTSQTLNPDIIATTFGVSARVEHCSRGTPFILIDDILTA